MGISNIDTVYATEVIAAEGAAAIVEWLVAALATIGLGEAAYENREALASSYWEYLKSRVELGDYITDSAKSICIQIYDTASNTIQNISWNDFMGSLDKYHNTSADSLTGIYAKYCPRIISGIDDFLSNVLNEDIYVTGVSDAIVEYDTISSAEIGRQWSGEPYTYEVVSTYKCAYNNYTKKNIFRTKTNTPFCLYWDSGHAALLFAFLHTSWGPITTTQGWIDNYIVYADGTESHSGSIRRYGIGMCHSSSSVCRDTWSISTNCPILSNKAEAENYLNGISDSSAILNYGNSIYDNIIDNNDLPPFSKAWQQELWERVASAPDIGIGSYGTNENVDQWVDVIDWVSINSLSEYADSIQDIYEKSINDILNGVYEKHEDIPNTYSEAWEMATSDAWEDKVDTPAAGSMVGENEKTEPNESEESEVTPEKLISEIPDEYKEVFQCKQFADELEKLMQKNNIPGERILIQNEVSDYILSNQHGIISENGIHEAIRINNIVFDNMNSNGINYDDWLFDLGVSDSPSLFDIITKPIN